MYVYLSFFFYSILFSERCTSWTAATTPTCQKHDPELKTFAHCGALSFRTPLVFWRSLVHAAMFLPRACNKSLQENTSVVFCKASCGLISATKELCLVGTSTTFCNVEHVIGVAMPELCCLVTSQVNSLKHEYKRWETNAEALDWLSMSIWAGRFVFVLASSNMLRGAT